MILNLGIIYMKLVGVDIIEEAQKRHADAAKRLSAWKTPVTSKTTGVDFIPRCS